MSKIIRLILQVPLATLLLLTLVAAVNSQREGFKPLDALICANIAAFMVLFLWITSLIGSPEIHDEEWRKKYLSTDGPPFIWSRRLVVLYVVLTVGSKLI